MANSTLSGIAAGAVLFLASAMLTMGQSPRAQCPSITVFASVEEVTVGDSVVFHVSVTGGDVDLSQIRFSWYLSDGKFIGPSDTPAIVVDTTGVKTPGSVTATVSIGNLEACCMTATETAGVVAPRQDKKGTRDQGRSSLNRPGPSLIRFLTPNQTSSVNITGILTRVPAR